MGSYKGVIGIHACYCTNMGTLVSDKVVVITKVECMG